MIVVAIPQPPPPKMHKLELPRPGAGTHLTANAMGVAVSGPTAGATWSHPWRPAKQAKGVILTAALVQSRAGDGPLEPKIKFNGELVPMSGKNGQNPPALALDPAVANSDGVSFAVLEVEPDDKGELVKASRIEIVHSLEVISKVAEIGRFAVLQILWKKRAVFRIRPCVHFNLVYSRVLPQPGGGLPRHYFT